MTLSLIVAMSENRVIGRDGNIPWHVSSDLKRFKKITIGHPMIMGRKTWESLGKSLPGRTSIVLTRNADYEAEGASVVHDLDAAIAQAPQSDEVFVVGGADIYRLAMPRVDRMYLTVVHAAITGDTYFPDFDESLWEVREHTQHEAGERDDYPHSFLVMERRIRPEA